MRCSFAALLHPSAAFGATIGCLERGNAPSAGKTKQDDNRNYGYKKESLHKMAVF